MENPDPERVKRILVLLDAGQPSGIRNRWRTKAKAKTDSRRGRASAYHAAEQGGSTSGGHQKRTTGDGWGASPSTQPAVKGDGWGSAQNTASNDRAWGAQNTPATGGGGWGTPKTTTGDGGGWGRASMDAGHDGAPQKAGAQRGAFNGPPPPPPPGAPPKGGQVATTMPSAVGLMPAQIQMPPISDNIRQYPPYQYPTTPSIPPYPMMPPGMTPIPMPGVQPMMGVNQMGMPPLMMGPMGMAMGG